jgi:peptidoglycan hydrolase-like protein with peptidoglycan-binding domain
MGSIGERVRQLQAGLAQLGFAVGDIDSEFGPITSAAVSAFPSAHGLPPTGIAEQATQHALASRLTPESTGTIRRRHGFRALRAAARHQGHRARLRA